MRLGRPRLSSEETARRGQVLYEQCLREKVETAENIGKLLSIDVESGDYEIGDDTSLDAVRTLRAGHPDAAVAVQREVPPPVSLARTLRTLEKGST